MYRKILVSKKRTITTLVPQLNSSSSRHLELDANDEPADDDTSLDLSTSDKETSLKSSNEDTGNESVTDQFDDTFKSI